MDGWVISTLDLQIGLFPKCLLSFDIISGGTPPFQFLITPVSLFLEMTKPHLLVVSAEKCRLKLGAHPSRLCCCGVAVVVICRYPSYLGS